jgi:hypothetical protein
MCPVSIYATTKVLYHWAYHSHAGTQVVDHSGGVLPQRQMSMDRSRIPMQEVFHQQ